MFAVGGTVLAVTAARLSKTDEPRTLPEGPHGGLQASPIVTPDDEDLDGERMLTELRSLLSNTNDTQP